MVHITLTLSLYELACLSSVYTYKLNSSYSFFLSTLSFAVNPGPRHIPTIWAATRLPRTTLAFAHGVPVIFSHFTPIAIPNAHPKHTLEIPLNHSMTFTIPIAFILTLTTLTLANPISDHPSPHLVRRGPACYPLTCKSHQFKAGSQICDQIRTGICICSESGEWDHIGCEPRLTVQGLVPGRCIHHGPLVACT